ncbi:MAG: hypothetical protein AABM41_07090 [Chloroflexota bacterium]
MPDVRGDVLCPTCGRWTPPAPFCNECGAALQVGFRDPVGGQGSDVFRRGHEVDEPGAPWSGPTERFEPEPEDQAAQAAATAGAAAGSRVDNLSEADEAPPEPSWPAEPGLAARPPPPADETAAASPAAAGPAPRKRSRATAAPATTSAAIAASAAGEPAPPPPVVPPPPPPPYRPAQPPEASGGVSGLVFVVFLGLGILALLGGAILGGVFDAGPTAEASPSATPLVATSTPEPTSPEPSVAATPTTTAAPSAIPSGAEPTFPDGFLARAEACDDEPSGSTCDDSGAVNSGEPWILVSFRHGKPTDVIGIAIVDSSGAVQDTASLSLAFCQTNTDCPGYTYDRFGPLDPGTYEARVTRNGTAAATTSFRVE